MPQKNVAIFIDFWNINKSIDELKAKGILPRRSKIHFKKLSDFTTIGKNVFLKNIYLAQPENNGFEFFIKSMHRAGLKTITKPLKIIRTSNGSEKKKGDLDVEITRDICEVIFTGTPCDEFILYSGDSDFAVLANLIKSYNAKFTVVSTSDCVSIELIEAADKLVILDEIDKDFYVM